MLFSTRSRIHGQRCADIGLTRGVADLERLVIHADVVGRHVEELGLRRVGRRLLVLLPNAAGQMPLELLSSPLASVDIALTRIGLP